MIPDPDAEAIVAMFDELADSPRHATSEWSRGYINGRADAFRLAASHIRRVSSRQAAA
jgi:hypothetical protein